MKKLNEELNYDTSLPFGEQSQKVQDYINEFVNINLPDTKLTEPAGYYPRPTLERWLIGELKVENIYNYVYPATHEKNGEHTMERRYV